MSIILGLTHGLCKIKKGHVKNMQFGSKLLQNERMFLNGASSTNEGSSQVVEKNSPEEKKSDKGKKRLHLVTDWIIVISLLSVLALGIYVAEMSTHTSFKNVDGYVSMTCGNNLMQTYLLEEHGEKIKYAEYIKGDKHSFSKL